MDTQFVSQLFEYFKADYGVKVDNAQAAVLVLGVFKARAGQRDVN